MLRFGGQSPPDGIDPTIAIVPCGYESTTTFYPGTRFGPRRLLEASEELELYDLEIGISPFDAGIVTVPEPEIRDDPGAMLDLLSGAISQELARNRFPLLIGGEHTIAIAGVRAALVRFPDLGVLQLDAHSDFRDTYRGNKLNHACVGRRFTEMAPLVMAGVRSVSEKEFACLRDSSKVKFFPMQRLRETGWSEEIISNLPQHVYLSIDLDVFDPSLVPGVGNPEPGGLAWVEMTHLLDQLFQERDIIGADVCELCPHQGNVVSESVAARLVQRVCSLHVDNVKS